MTLARYRWGWVALMLLVAIPATSRAEHPHSACPPSLYSPLHYWAPSLYRLNLLHPGHTASAPYDRYPGLPAPQYVVRFPCPAVTPSQYYSNTGLSYDPTRPYRVMSTEPASTLPAMPK